MKSIRSYLLTRLMGGAAVVVGVAAVIVYLMVAQSLERQFDADMSQRVQGFASLLFQVKDQVSFEFSGQLMPSFEARESPDYFQIHYVDGRLLERSDSLNDHDLTVPITPRAFPEHWTAELPDGRTGRFVAQLVEVHHVYPEEGPDRPQAAVVKIVIARGREGLVATERYMLVLCAGVALALMGLIAIVTWTAVGRGLAPANNLAGALDAVRVDDLPNELGLGRMPAELQPVADKTEALMQRVQDALERERRTSADIAHELRTPISEIITASEVALRKPNDPAHAREALLKARDTAWRMGRAVSTLLELTRLEQNGQAARREYVPLAEIVRQVLASYATVERERGLRIDNQVAPRTVVAADSDALEIVLSNLVGNAMYHSPRGGSVRCRMEQQADEWKLVIENPAPELNANDLPLLTEPFWRKDHARTDGNRSGLGLTLSEALARASGMQLVFELDSGILRAQLSGGAPEVRTTATDRSTVL
ncbi:MAG: sensor histidine kinase N-terminal domain-containing protein [Planctomycetes bacterium]|nr:sensor histidine kinase N-terminal domain-containing protein [Planctomycetota bacterium]